MRKKRRRKTTEDLRQAKIRAMQQMFYEDVCIYMAEEYDEEVFHHFFNSPIAGKLLILVNKYYWVGVTVPECAGQVADLIKSKYLK